MAVSQWGFSKGFGTLSMPIDSVRCSSSRSTWSDDATPIGPCLVSASQIPDPQVLPLKTVVNGKTLQDGSTAYDKLPLRAYNLLMYINAAT